MIMTSAPQSWTAMPAGNPNDEQQQRRSSAFNGNNNNLQPDRSIWSNRGKYPQAGHARGPSVPSNGTANFNGNGSGNDFVADGPVAFGNSNDSYSWYGDSAVWRNTDNRPTSTSPTTTRPAGLPKLPSLNNGTDPLSSVRGAFQDNSMSMYRSSYDSSHADSIPTLTSQLPSAPPSRQSQPSPGFKGGLYGGRVNGHGHSNSFQAPSSNYSMTAAHQSTNFQAFNANGAIENDLPQSSMPSFRPTMSDMVGARDRHRAQSSRLNPSTQPFANANGSSFNNGPDHDQMDILTQRLAVAGLQRSSFDRMSPASSFRPESGNSSSNYSQTPELLNSRSSSRDPRAADSDRRGSAPTFVPPMHNPYLLQYSYQNGVHPQVASHLPPSYLQTLGLPYQTPQYSPYAMPPGYPMVPGISRPANDQASSQNRMSQSMREYKAAKTKHWELRHCFGHVCEFSGDQHGSRFIQHKLEQANGDEKEQIFSEIEPNALVLMKDVFGNYVVQKFFDHGNQTQKKILADKIKSDMYNLSKSTYGCRVVQKALEHVLVDQQIEMVQKLEPTALEIIKDVNGNHVIQKIIEYVPQDHLGFLTAALHNNVEMLSNHQYGCRVVQRMMNKGTQAQKDAVLSELRPCAQSLLRDQFGNYVAQHIIKYGSFDDRVMMVNHVLSSLGDLCKHKYASNVVETCIMYGVPELRTLIRERFEAVGADGQALLPQLIPDNFGNYVIQKMATFLSGDEQTAFIRSIEPICQELRSRGTNARQLGVMDKMIDDHANNCLKPDEKQPLDKLDSAVPAPGITQAPVETESSPTTNGN